MYPNSTSYSLPNDLLWAHIEQGKKPTADEAAAIATINAYCNRRFSKQEATCRWSMMRCVDRLQLPLYPIADPDDIHIVDNDGKIYRHYLDDPNSLVMQDPIPNGVSITLTYTGGYTADSLPQPIRSAGAIMAQAQTILYPSNAAGNIAMSSNRIPTTWETGLQGQRLGGDKQPDQLEFEVEMPAKAIPYAAKQLLNPYRRMTV